MKRNCSKARELGYTICIVSFCGIRLQRGDRSRAIGARLASAVLLMALAALGSLKILGMDDDIALLVGYVREIIEGEQFEHGVVLGHEVQANFVVIEAAALADGVLDVGHALSNRHFLGHGSLAIRELHSDLDIAIDALYLIVLTCPIVFELLQLQSHTSAWRDEFILVGRTKRAKSGQQKA